MDKFNAKKSTTKRHVGPLTKTGVFVSSLTAVVMLAVILLPTKALADSNLLTNPGFETGDLTGWNLIQDGGDGWSNSWGAHSGNDGFDTSYEMDNVSQQVNVLSNGYTQSQLDSLQPSITFSVWLNDRCDSGAQFYITYELIGSDGSTIIASSGNTFGNSGSTMEVPTPCGTWKKQSYTFTNYGPGVKYAYIEFGGYSDNFWAGNYGAQFDDASISLSSIPTVPSALGPNNVTTGKNTTNKPSFAADINTPGLGNEVKYEIQISTTNNFSKLLVDYVSALASPGLISFKVGQNNGSGAYYSGRSGQTLPNGSYYWRIKAISDDTFSSTWVTANKGAVAFTIGNADPKQSVQAPSTGNGIYKSKYLSETWISFISLFIGLTLTTMIVYRTKSRSKLDT